jgi:hypothetical protein
MPKLGTEASAVIGTTNLADRARAAPLVPSTADRKLRADASDAELGALLEAIAEVSKHVRNILFALVTIVAFVLLAAAADRQITLERRTDEAEAVALTSRLHETQARTGALQRQKQNSEGELARKDAAASEARLHFEEAARQYDDQRADVEKIVESQPRLQKIHDELELEMKRRQNANWSVSQLEGELATQMAAAASLKAAAAAAAAAAKPKSPSLESSASATAPAAAPPRRIGRPRRHAISPGEMAEIAQAKVESLTSDLNAKRESAKSAARAVAQKNKDLRQVPDLDASEQKRQELLRVKDDAETATANAEAAVALQSGETVRLSAEVERGKADEETARKEKEASLAKLESLKQDDQKRSVPLPLLGLSVKSGLFFVVGPWLLAFVFWYLRIYLSELELRARWFDEAADERAWSTAERMKRIYPWLVNFARYGALGTRLVAGFAVDWMTPCALMALCAAYHVGGAGSFLVELSMSSAFALTTLTSGVSAFRNSSWTSLRSL